MEEKKTILITGATDGIGLETAKLFAKNGHKLLIHGRNPKKLEQVKDDLLEMNSDVQIFLADLSILKQTKELAENIISNVDQIDVIINNAGVFVLDDTMTTDGIDARFAVNTLSPYLLTKMLLPILKEHGRIINLTSAAQMSIDFDAMKGKKKLSHDSAYAQSKLAILMWGMEMADQLKDKVVIINVNPKSFLGSKMVQTAYGRKGYDLSIGAKVLYRASLSNEFADKTGCYFDNDSGVFASPHPFALSHELRKKLINTMEEMLRTFIAQ